MWSNLCVNSFVLIVRLFLSYLQYFGLVWMIISLIVPCFILFAQGAASDQWFLKQLFGLLNGWLILHSGSAQGEVSLDLGDILKIISTSALILCIVSTAIQFLLSGFFQIVIDISMRSKTVFLLILIHVIYLGAAGCGALFSKNAKPSDLWLILGICYVFTMGSAVFYLFIDSLLRRCSWSVTTDQAGTN